MAYIIETYFAVSDTWENTYTETVYNTSNQLIFDSKPLVFNSKSDAEHELNLMLEQAGYDYEHGYTDYPINAQDYRIKEVQS